MKIGFTIIALTMICSLGAGKPFAEEENELIEDKVDKTTATETTKAATLEPPLLAALVGCLQAQTDKTGKILHAPRLELYGSKSDAHPVISCRGTAARQFYVQAAKRFKSGKLADPDYVGFLSKIGSGSVCMKYAHITQSPDVFQYICIISLGLDSCFTDALEGKPQPLVRTGK